MGAATADDPDGTLVPPSAPPHLFTNPRLPAVSTAGLNSAHAPLAVPPCPSRHDP